MLDMRLDANISDFGVLMEDEYEDLMLEEAEKRRCWTMGL